MPSPTLASRSRSSARAPADVSRLTFGLPMLSGMRGAASSRVSHVMSEAYEMWHSSAGSWSFRSSRVNRRDKAGR